MKTILVLSVLVLSSCTVSVGQTHPSASSPPVVSPSGTCLQATQGLLQVIALANEAMKAYAARDVTTGDGLFAQADAKATDVVPITRACLDGKT